MDTRQFDALTRAFTSSRRAFGAIALALVAGRFGLSHVAAKHKHKHHHKHNHPTKTAKRNFFGCVDVGKACASAGDCCSGICQGKKGKKLCVAHGTGTCDQAVDGFCESSDPEQLNCNDNPRCTCITTTAGSKFCGDPGPDVGSGCAPCKTDADCESLHFPPGSACAPVAAGNCVTSPCNGFACFVPCELQPPAS